MLLTIVEVRVVIRPVMASLRRKFIHVYVEDCVAHYAGSEAELPERTLRKLTKLRKYEPITSLGSSSFGSYPYRIMETVQFRKDVKSLKGREEDLLLLENAIGMLAKGADLRAIRHTVRSGGHISAWREYRMESGLSLIYSIEGDTLTLLALAVYL